MLGLVIVIMVVGRGIEFVVIGGIEPVLKVV